MMKKTWLPFCLTLGLVLVFVLTPNVAFAGGGNVTFQVNMKIKMLEGSFLPGSGDIVRVAGSFNDWGNSTDTLADGDGDSIYTRTIGLAFGPHTYKFLKSLRAGLDWESGSDRPLTNVAGDTTLPVAYFDYDSVYTPPSTQVAVTFQAIMRVKILEGTFDPDTDQLLLRGNFNGFGTGDTLVDPQTDSIYSRTLMLDEGFDAVYKFFSSGGLDWESGSDRHYIVPTGGGTLTRYFNDDSVVSVPINANILFKTDMNALLNMGWFRPDLNDSIEARGAFNNWSGTKMDDPFQTGVYELLVPYSGTSNDIVEYKFFIDFDSAGATTRFPGYVHNDGGIRDGFSYEHPGEGGDGNRRFDVGFGGNIAPPVYWYSSNDPRGVINAGDTVTVTAQVNMGPATRYIDAFVPGSDTVRLMFFDQLVRGAQRANQGSFADNIMLSPVGGPTDTIYSGSFTYVGPTHYNFIYHYRYTHAGGGNVDEGGGLGVQDPYRSSYVQPLGPNNFPRNYSAPLAVWQKNAPMPTEDPPFGALNGVEEFDDVRPSAYRLLQNFPNPFNPSTKIRYTIPERAIVSLKVFNLLGQEIATLVNQEQGQGNYVALFDANSLATGIYFYRLQAGAFTEVKKMLLLK